MRTALHSMLGTRATRLLLLLVRLRVNETAQKPLEGSGVWCSPTVLESSVIWIKAKGQPGTTVYVHMQVSYMHVQLWHSHGGRALAYGIG